MSSMERNNTLDLLKVTMALMVVGIHYNPFQDASETVALVTEHGLFRIAVPAFFVLNGYFLSPMLEKGRIGSYLTRILGLYAIWMAIYAPRWVSEWLDMGASPPEFLEYILLGYWHLWYLPALAIAAGVLWLVRRWSTWYLLALAGSLFLIGAFVHLGTGMGIGLLTDRSLNIHRNGLFLGVPFVVLGAVIRRTAFEQSAWVWVWIGLAVLAFFVLMVETVTMNRLTSGKISYDNLFSTGLAAPLLVLAALRLPNISLPVSLGPYANGIYFAHIGVMLLCFRLGLDSEPAFFGLFVLGSVGCTWLIQRVGLGRYLL